MVQSLSGLSQGYWSITPDCARYESCVGLIAFWDRLNIYEGPAAPLKRYSRHRSQNTSMCGLNWANGGNDLSSDGSKNA